MNIYLYLYIHEYFIHIYIHIYLHTPLLIQIRTTSAARPLFIFYLHLHVRQIWLVYCLQWPYPNADLPQIWRNTFQDKMPLTHMRCGIIYISHMLCEHELWATFPNILVLNDKYRQENNFALVLFIVGTSLRNCRVNTLRSRQNGRHFADDILKCIFLSENV